MSNINNIKPAVIQKQPIKPSNKNIKIPKQIEKQQETSFADKLQKFRTSRVKTDNPIISQNKRLYTTPYNTKFKRVNSKKPIKSLSVPTPSSPATYPKFVVSDTKILEKNIGRMDAILISSNTSISINPLDIIYFREYMTLSKYTNIYMIRVFIRGDNILPYTSILESNDCKLKIVIYDINNNKLYDGVFEVISSNIIKVMDQGVPGGSSKIHIMDLVQAPSLYNKLYKNYKFRKFPEGSSIDQIVTQLQADYNSQVFITGDTKPLNNTIYKYSNMTDIDFLKYLSILQSNNNYNLLYHIYVNNDVIVSINNEYLKTNPIIIDETYRQYAIGKQYIINKKITTEHMLTMYTNSELINVLDNTVKYITNISSTDTNLYHMVKQTYPVFSDDDVLLEHSYILKNKQKINLVKDQFIIMLSINIPNVQIFSHINVTDPELQNKFGFKKGIVLGYLASVDALTELRYTTIMIIHKTE